MKPRPEPSAASLALDPEALLSHDRWLRALVARLVDPDRVDDVVQETWIQAFSRPPASASALRSWLATVARNFARRIHRTGLRRQQREERAATPEAQPATAELVQRVEAQRQVAKLVLELAEPYRTTVLLRYFDELSTAQIATRMGVPHATVRTRLQRAMARLRKDLGEQEGGQWQARYAALVLGVPEFSAAASTVITKTLWTGAFWMGTKLKVAAAAVMLAAGMGVTLWARSIKTSKPKPQRLFGQHTKQILKHGKQSVKVLRTRFASLKKTISQPRKRKQGCAN